MERKPDNQKHAYEILKDIVVDYIENMNGINERRINLLRKDMNCVEQEGKMFNLLQQNVHNIQEQYGIPEGQ